MKKELLSIKVPLIIKNNCYERGNHYVVGDLTKMF